MMSNEKCCGRCKYCRLESITDGWVCTNADSEYLSDWVDRDFSCEAWESRGHVAAYRGRSEGSAAKYKDRRGWKYKVMSGIGDNSFKGRYQKPEKSGSIGWKCMG